MNVLPELPRRIKKREANFGLQFRAFIKANPQHTCAYELKQTLTDSIAFAALEPHQADYLSAIQGLKGVLMRTKGETGMPDYVYLREVPAYVVIRYPDCFVMIRIDIFLREQKNRTKKSLSTARARTIAQVVVDL